MASPILRKFMIDGLFGKKNIVLEPSSECSILIGENGLGKTTILSIIYCVVRCQFQKLAQYSFSKIRFAIADQYFTLTKEEIDSYAIAYGQYSADIDLDVLPTVLRIFKDIQIKDITPLQLVEAFRIRGGLRRRYGIVKLDRVGKLADFLQHFLNIFTVMKTCATLKYIVEYLPTYRRIEADLERIIDDFRNSRSSYERNYRTLPFDDEDDARLIKHMLKDRASIKFGMEDIDELLKNLLNSISDKSVTAFSNISGGMISKLLEKDFKVIKTEFKKSEVEIVLQRSGRSLDSKEKERILEMIDTHEIYDDKYLVYFLSQLVEEYRKQKAYDEALKGFVEACNEFLEDKKFFYNESSLKIGLYYRNDEKHQKVIDLNFLSSGEKQLVSIIAKVYLTLTSDVILLIDEPELSLSIQWQKKLLPVLIKADRCRQIIAVTHSPFIFSNKLEDNAIGSLEYVRYDS